VLKVVSNLKSKKNYIEKDFKKLWQSSIGFLTIWTAHLGRRYGLFSILADSKRPLIPSELSEILNLQVQPVEKWCETAYSLELIEKKNKKYFLEPSMIELLIDETNPNYLGGQISYLALRSLDFTFFDSHFMDGETQESESKYLAESFHQVTKWDHTIFLERILPQYSDLKRLLENGGKVLDIGCGSGEWIFEMTKKFPYSIFTGIEPNAESISRAKQKVKKLGLNQNIFFKTGTAESIELSDEFDLIYLGEVLYIISEKNQVLKKSYDALKSQGAIIVVEGLIDESTDPRNLDNKLLYGLQLEISLQGGCFLTKDELSQLIKKAGFRKEKIHDVGGGLYFTYAIK
jgi:ubiquinone/menaquinone biosynthesis C-methylase UbiE